MPSRKKSWSIGRGLLIAPSVVGVAAGVIEAVQFDGSARWTLLANAGLLVVLLAERELVVRIVAARHLGLVSLLYLTAVLQPISLIVAAGIQGDVMYLAGEAIYSHFDGGVLVACAQAVFYTAVCCSVVAWGLLLSPRRWRWMEVVERVEPRTLRLAEISSWFVMAARLGVLVGRDQIGDRLQYFLRLEAALFVGVFFFLGVGLRRGSRLAGITVPVNVLFSAFLLLTGSRMDALYPPLLVAVGYALARPTSQARLVAWAGVGTAVLMIALFVGSVVRTDQRGRSAEAGLERLNRLGDAVSTGRAEETPTESTVRRILRNSTHAVITRVPDLYPFEQNGLTKIPFELVDKALPRFNYAGRSENELPRNWMLNDLGFMVNWSTSVELAVVADGWYRGGFAGLAVVGAVVGAVLGLLEALINRKVAAKPSWIIMWVFCASGIILIEGRDLVIGFRSLVFLFAAGQLFLTVDRMARVGVAVGRRKVGLSAR